MKTMHTTKLPKLYSSNANTQKYIHQNNFVKE